MSLVRKSFMFVLLLGALLLAACGTEKAEFSETKETSSSADGETYQFKLGHIAPPDHMWNEAAEKFAEELETRSVGRMTLEIYPGGQLGNEADMVQQLESGSLDFGFIPNAYITSKSEAFSAWFAPFLFDSYDEALEAKETDVAKEILATLDVHGLKALDIFFSGHRTIMSKEKAETPEDFEGMSFRVAPGPALEDWYRILGASPESITLPEVYQSLETGVIDGVEVDLEVAVTSNFDEVTNHVTMTNMVWPAIMIINKNLYDNMSEEDQTIVREAMAAAAEYAILESKKREEEYRAQFVEKGLEVYDIDESLYEEQTREFDEKYRALDPLIDEFLGQFRD